MSAEAASALPGPAGQGFGRELLDALARLGRRPRLFGWREVLQQFDQTGPRALPIVLLACGLVGLMLGYMGGAQLARIGGQLYVADVVTVGMVRELAGLMTGVILAGRVSSTFAAHLASMTAQEEIDALRAMGIDPVGHLVLPRLIALLMAFPLLMGFGAVAGVAAGWAPAVLSYGATTAEYLQHSRDALTWTHLWIGTFKGLLYAVVLGLAGCRAGMRAGRSAEAVGRAATQAVVTALVLIVAVACLTTVVFTLMGY
jgi:phospholipid/cholesterol/gamma-HCH transport system permease protein